MLEGEKRRTVSLERQNVEMRKRMGIQQSQIEAEEELITNKLMARIEEIEKEKSTLRQKVEKEESVMKQEKSQLESKLQQTVSHLARLKQEKEMLVRQVEQEEEFLTNTLQHKLSKVLAEKVEIENRLEQEQEYISNRLQKQVSDTQKEKAEMERRLEEEQAKVKHMEEEKKKLAAQLQSLQLHVEMEEENISNKLGKTVDAIKSEKEVLLHKLEKEKAAAAQLRMEHETQRQELKKLQGSNFVLQQRIDREESKLSVLQRQKAHMAQVLEAEWERQLNVMLRQRETPEGQSGSHSHPSHHKLTSGHFSGSGGFRTRSFSVDRDSVISETPPQIDFFDEEADLKPANNPDMDGDVVGELSLTPRIARGDSKRRSGRWESQSLPCYSPRLSPYPSPPPTPYDRSCSPAYTRTSSQDATPSTSRSQSPSVRSSHSSIVSSLSAAETLSWPVPPPSRQFGKFPVHGKLESVPPPPRSASGGSGFSATGSGVGPLAESIKEAE